MTAVLWIIPPVAGAILPDHFAGSPKAGSKAVQGSDPALFEEYGFEEGEQAAYGASTVTTWRFRDSTGALGAWQFLRPADAKPLASKLDKYAVKSGKSALFLHGNFVFEFAGKVPADQQLAPLYGALAKLDVSSLPVISTWLPAAGLAPNSERFIAGPVALQRFLPKVPPSVAAFHLSAEAQYGRYRTEKGEMGLALFNYPTPSMARERAEAFQKTGALAKRSGPLVAVIPEVSDPDAAERLLAKVRYESTLTMNERTPAQEARGFAKSMLEMFMLAGLLIGGAIVAGALFAAVRIARRGGASATGEAMISLHIDSK